MASLQSVGVAVKSQSRFLFDMGLSRDLQQFRTLHIASLFGADWVNRAVAFTIAQQVSQEIPTADVLVVDAWTYFQVECDEPRLYPQQYTITVGFPFSWMRGLSMDLVYAIGAYYLYCWWWRLGDAEHLAFALFKYDQSYQGGESMAKVTVQGSVVNKKFFPSEGDRDAQFLVNVQDQESGQRFGMFVPEEHPVAETEVGQILRCTGNLSVNRSGQYVNLNLNDVIDVKRFQLTEVK
jgi:hypothetical protein